MDNDESPPQNKKDDDTQIEQILFQEAMRGVKPLKQPGKIERNTSPAPRSAISERRRQAVGVATMPDTLSDHLAIETAENGDWSFIRPGLQRQALRKLRRGDWPVQAQLDLHGLTREAARRTLTAFLTDCIQRDYRCVRIIHGKGLSSANKQPVLKMLAGNWLAQHESVLAFCQAQLENGGSGALEVLLKKQQRDKKISEP